jgi:hypothetical protein
MKIFAILSCILLAVMATVIFVVAVQIGQPIAAVFSIAAAGFSAYAVNGLTRF